MHTHTKLILATFVATMLLAVGVNGAPARNLRISERAFEVIWNEAVGVPKTKFEFIDRSDNINIQCRLTLLGRFSENTIIKETSRDQGTINHGEIESCAGGTVTLKTETMPWGIRYRGFTGTLPVIKSVTAALIGVRWKVRETNGLECESATEITHPGVGIAGNSAEASETGLERTGEPSDITAERGTRIPLSGEFVCSLAGEGEFGGIGLIRNLPRNALLRITLI